MYLCPSVDAVRDAAGKGGLEDAVTLPGGPARVMVLADDHAGDLGVAFSAPTPGRAAEAHRLLESGEAHEKLVLEA